MGQVAKWSGQGEADPKEGKKLMIAEEDRWETQAFVQRSRSLRITYGVFPNELPKTKPIICFELKLTLTKQRKTITIKWYPQGCHVLTNYKKKTNLI